MKVKLAIQKLSRLLPDYTAHALKNSGWQGRFYAPFRLVLKFDNLSHYCTPIPIKASPSRMVRFWAVKFQ